MGNVWKVEEGVHVVVHGEEGWKNQLLCLSDGGRELLRVSRDGTVVLAADLTLDEAKALLVEMAGNCVTMMRVSD